MRRSLSLLALLPFLLSGCVYALRIASSPANLKLRIAAAQPQQLVVRVALDQPSDCAVPSDGRIELTVPSFSNGCDVYLFGLIKTRDGSAEHVRILHLVRDGRILRKLSLAQVAKLQKDDMGFAIVAVKD